MSIAEITREHWIQRITFAAATNAAAVRRDDSQRCGHIDRHRRRATQYFCSLGSGKGNYDKHHLLDVEHK